MNFSTFSLFKKLLLLIVAAMAVIWLAPFAIVPTGWRGVITTFGQAKGVSYEPGIHFRIPVAQTMHLMNVQIQNGEGEGEAASKDLQAIHTKVAINYHLDPKRVVDAFMNVGPSTDILVERIIIPATHESVKAVTARFTAEELITRRTEVRDAIVVLLKDKMQRHGLILDEFNLINFSFSKSFSEAIENKVRAEQLKQQAERDLQRMQIEAEQKLVGAKAEAESLALQRQQITPDLLTLRRIENERMAISKWNGVLPSVTGGAVPFLQIDPDAKR
ncbi:prohibitin family protein [Candidatus Symbiobacter mobilis]|uniref:Membrane protease subunit n=1 Tax=Candidatus Symbiobacter mobilis CR TaxID=946483 RepID=U5N8N6_9BURK|nr:prohibitin family protein [Candidatus Symbiobacter mobilis]AGX87767.1 membrane protease subunit [Candidatus Symbiobacter mobilis CR]